MYIHTYFHIYRHIVRIENYLYSCLLNIQHRALDLMGVADTFTHVNQVHFVVYYVNIIQRWINRMYWSWTVALFHPKIHYQNTWISCLLFFLKLKLSFFLTRCNASGYFDKEF